MSELPSPISSTASLFVVSLIVSCAMPHRSVVAAGIWMCEEAESEPVKPRASQTPLALLAAVRHALIFAAASEPENRSAFCTPLSEFTAAEPLTSRLYCGFVVFTPSEVAVKRCTACIWFTGGHVYGPLVKFDPVSVALDEDAPLTKSAASDAFA